jgi:hypothetical protein
VDNWTMLGIGNGAASREMGNQGPSIRTPLSDLLASAWNASPGLQKRATE